MGKMRLSRPLWCGKWALLLMGCASWPLLLLGFFVFCVLVIVFVVCIGCVLVGFVILRHCVGGVEMEDLGAGLLTWVRKIGMVRMTWLNGTRTDVTVEESNRHGEYCTAYCGVDEMLDLGGESIVGDFTYAETESSEDGDTILWYNPVINIDNTDSEGEILSEIHSANTSKPDCEARPGVTVSESLQLVYCGDKQQHEVLSLCSLQNKVNQKEELKGEEMSNLHRGGEDREFIEEERNTKEIKRKDMPDGFHDHENLLRNVINWGLPPFEGSDSFLQDSAELDYWTEGSKFPTLLQFWRNIEGAKLQRRELQYSPNSSV